MRDGDAGGGDARNELVLGRCRPHLHRVKSGESARGLGARLMLRLGLPTPLLLRHQLAVRSGAAALVLAAAHARGVVLRQNCVNMTKAAPR